MKPWSASNLEARLMCNRNWTGEPPYLKGKTYSEALDAWTVKKIIVLRTMVADMDKCELLNLNEYACKVFEVIARQLVSAGWNRPCGAYAIWKAMYRKASMKVQQETKREPQPIGNLIHGALVGIQGDDD